MNGATLSKCHKAPK